MFDAQVASAWLPDITPVMIPTYSVLSATAAISWTDEYFDFLGSRINGWIVLGTIIINSVIIIIIIMHLDLLLIWLIVS